MTNPLGFRAAYKFLAIPFSAVSLCVYPYVWYRHPGVLQFMDNAFDYQIPVWIAHACVAWAVSRAPAQRSAYDSGGETDELELIVINPGSRLPMVGGIDGVDTEGNAFGGYLDD